ncbi:MAG: M20/M25/M40 family metallo-hydrolase [Spirochaetaceae bacterium]|nr:M20/M25/M40 family metallo-hydrolase [Spirochaetaceae bacterium]
MKNSEDYKKILERLPEKLACLVQCKTVSYYDPEKEDEGEFTRLKAGLSQLYPLVNAKLRLDKPSNRALLYTWEGKDPSLAPVILCAHFDVVPPGDEAAWLHGPFSGELIDGELWGRGTQDIKVLMACILEAAESLLGQGFQPKHTIYFAFGGDEEIGGSRGAHAIGEFLGKQGVKASFLLDEGGPIAVRMLSFVERPLALIGVAEKGYADMVVTAEGQGGHASMPPRHTATGNLGRAIAYIEGHPSPARLTGTIRSFLSLLAPYSRQPYHFLFSALWLTAPAIRLAFAASPTTNALIRTTAACTMLQGSMKENVLADHAEANLNVRILPGESSQQVLERLAIQVKPFGASVFVKHPEAVVEPSAESGTDNEGWKAIVSALAVSHPSAACVPFLFSAGTDTKHYKDIVQATYRLTALPQDSEALERVHGDNERVNIEDLLRCGYFYLNLMESM